MTVIVARRVGPGEVVVGGDCLGSAGWDSTPRRDEKVFRLPGGIVIGFCGSYRLGQILRYQWESLTQAPPRRGETEWMHRTFIPHVRTLFRDHGHTSTENGRETLGGAFIAAVRGVIFTVEGDLQVGIPARPYAAQGAGASYALGAFYAGGTVTAALEAACAFSASCQGPFTLLSTKPPGQTAS